MVQVTKFGADEHNHYVLASSLRDLLVILNQKVDDGAAKKDIFKDENNKKALVSLL